MLPMHLDTSYPSTWLFTSERLSREELDGGTRTEFLMDLWELSRRQFSGAMVYRDVLRRLPQVREGNQRYLTNRARCDDH